MLAVLKRFGDKRSPGLLSFPEPGLTLALDFRNRDGTTLKLLDRLDGIVAAAKGRLYAAKDARMSRRMFLGSYSNVDRFSKQLDPLCESEFWKKMA